MGDVRLSVVIAAHNACAVIEACLLALEPQALTVPLEVIVADSSTDGTAELVRRRFPWVRLMHFERPLAVPALRGRGIGTARGTIVAILDPYSVAAADWAECVLNAHARRDNLVIGGSVDLYHPHSCSWATWAVYLNEYGLFMPPVVQGKTWIVPGSNLSYKRAALFDGSAPRYPVFWKTYVNWEIERAGSALWLDPDIRVELNKPIAFGDFLRTRYHHGRCFAGMRLENASTATRVLRAGSTVLIPMLQLWRWSRGFWTKRRRRWQFVLTLPAQAALFTVWAWGEACGYLRGSGRCCEQLYY